MRELHFVRIADDGSQLVLQAADGYETFLLRPDAAVREALRPTPGGFAAPSPTPAAAPPVAAAAPAVAVTAHAEQPDIGPREIQVRVRAGESPEELAASLGVPVERISRFAAPVVDERRRIADEARRARARRGSDGAEGTGTGAPVVFGEAVDDRFGAHGIVATDVTWDSRRREDGEWVVVASWVGGDATRHAEWVFHRGARSVTPADETAADLLSDRPIRPVVPVAPQRPSLAAAPPLVPGIVAFPPMPDATTGPLPTLEPMTAEDVFDQEAEQPLLPAADLDFDAPPLPLGITDPTTRPAAAGPAARPAAAGTVGRLTAVRSLARREESDEERAARAKVPSWDDILLGVRRKQD